MRKLSHADYRQIRATLLLGGYTTYDLARYLGVSATEIARVADGRRRGGEQPGEPLALHYNRRTRRWVVDRRAGD